MAGMLLQLCLLSVLRGIVFCDGSSGSQILNDHGNYGGIDLSQDQKTFLIRSLTAIDLPPGTKVCETDEHCEPRHRCDDTIKLCMNETYPEFPLTIANVTCETNYQCPFLYRCAASSCHYFFFRACRTTTDCFQSSEWNWECRERSEQVPGRQCYRKCLMDRDCYECNGGSCRYPEYFQKIVSCCDGYCSKKIACDLDTVL